MSDLHPFGRAVSIWNFTEDNKVEINSDEIENIFNHPDVNDRNVVVISLIGAFRGGKSFFLDYCLRFLYAHVSILSDHN